MNTDAGTAAICSKNFYCQENVRLIVPRAAVLVSRGKCPFSVSVPAEELRGPHRRIAAGARRHPALPASDVEVSPTA